MTTRRMTTRGCHDCEEPAAGIRADRTTTAGVVVRLVRGPPVDGHRPQPGRTAPPARLGRTLLVVPPRLPRRPRLRETRGHERPPLSGAAPARGAGTSPHAPALLPLPMWRHPRLRSLRSAALATACLRRATSYGDQAPWCRWHREVPVIASFAHRVLRCVRAPHLVCATCIHPFVVPRSPSPPPLAVALPPARFHRPRDQAPPRPQRCPRQLPWRQAHMPPAEARPLTDGALGAQWSARVRCGVRAPAFRSWRSDPEERPLRLMSAVDAEGPQP